MKLTRNISILLGLSCFLFVLSSFGSEDSQCKYGELTSLADKYKTDKGSKRASFTEVYEIFLHPIKFEAKKIFEIGIAKGASLKMFRDYFPNAVIYGIDITDCSWLNSNTLKTFVADQANRKQLKGFIDTYGSDFDVILDDGGHTMEQQQTSFGFLFKHVKPGGYYIIEDVNTSIGLNKDKFGADKDEGNTTYTMITNFLRNTEIKSKYMTKEEEEYLTANIKNCNLLKTSHKAAISCIFTKKRR